MELRAYWAVIWRRIWFVALVLVVVAFYVGYQYYHLWKTPGALKAYHTSLTLQVGLQATPQGTDPSYEDDVLVSEALAETLATGPVLTMHEFDSAISQQIATDMDLIQQRYGAASDLGSWQDPGAIGAALSANRVHSLVSIDVVWSTEAGAWAVANALGEVASQNLGAYVDYVVSNDSTLPDTTAQIRPATTARVISSPSAPVLGSGASSSKASLLLLLLLLGLIVGVALAFLVDYLDDSIRDREDVAQWLKVPVYVELPRAPVSKGKPIRQPPAP